MKKITNKTISKVSLFALIILIAYSIFLLSTRSYSQVFLTYFIVIFAIGFFILSGFFLYYKNLSNEIMKDEEMKDDIKHFINEPVFEQKLVSKTEVIKDEKTIGIQQNIISEDPNISLKKALEALKNVNEIDKNIKRDF
jgi:hypothetical protein